MNSKNPLVQSSAIDTNAPSTFDYRGWREQFITVVLRIACVLGAALIAISFPTATASDRILFSILYIILLSITVLKTSYSVRASALLFLVYIIGTNSVLSWGPWLDSSIFFIAFIILAALLFDSRVDIFAMLLSILAFAVIAVLQQLNLYQFAAADVPITAPVDWITYVIDFSIISSILLVAINQFKSARTSYSGNAKRIPGAHLRTRTPGRPGTRTHRRT